jgi:hypothetical protein
MANAFPEAGGAASVGLVLGIVYIVGKVVGGGAASLNSIMIVPAGTFVSQPPPAAQALALHGEDLDKR